MWLHALEQSLRVTCVCCTGDPRLVTHVDDAFIARVTQLYRQRVLPDGEVLDLMSSWVSHLPSDRKYKRVTGHGMNAAEVCAPKVMEVIPG